MRRNSESSDGDLLRQMWSGDEDAFTQLYRRHQSAVYRFALQMSGKAGVAEEITQEVFMVLMNGSSSYEARKGPLPSFLYGVARNFVFRALQRERPYAASIDEADSPTGELAADSEDALTGLTRAEQIDALRQAILTLPELYREVVVLCELHELDYVQAAEVIGCPVGTVRSRLHRARALLVWKMRPSERCPA